MLISGLIDSLIKLNYNFSVQVQWRSKTGMYIHDKIIFQICSSWTKWFLRVFPSLKFYDDKENPQQEGSETEDQEQEKWHSFRECWQWASRYKHNQDHLKSSKRKLSFVPLFGGNKSFVSELIKRSTSIEFQHND